MTNKKKIPLIIIDDDFTSRNTIKNYLRKNYIYYIAYDFANANDALEWLKDYKADIAICDMRMPNIDGIEFISQASKLHPNLHFLAISAYSDFRYLRECMINSVDDYILKHELTADLLINTLDKIKEKYNINQGLIYPTNNNHIVEADRFTYNHIIETIKNGLIYFTPDIVLPVIISPDYNNEIFPDYNIFSNNIIYTIQDIIYNILDNRYSYLLHMTSSFQFALLLSFNNNENSAAIQGKRKSLFLMLKDKILRLLNITLTIAYSPMTMKLYDAMKFFNCLSSFNEKKIYLAPGSNFIFGETMNRFTDNYILPPYLKEQIKTITELRDFHSLKEIIHNVFIDFSNKSISHRGVVETCIKLCTIVNSILSGEKPNDYLKNINFHKFEHIGQFEKTIMNVIECMVKITSDNMKPIVSTAVARAISYIEEHYKDAISLEGCAEDVGISYAHLSRIFKKETALSFSEYLNRLRISKAKILLATNKLAIKQIVSETGFTNYNYFFRVFKEIEGITPIEYTVGANN